MNKVSSFMPYYNPNTLITQKTTVTNPQTNEKVYMAQKMLFRQICSVVFQANPKAKYLYDYLNSQKAGF